MGYLREKLRYDFGHLPDIVDRYVVHTPRSDALRAARQVTTVGTWLSKMAQGEPAPVENAYYAVAIVCLDEVTDECGDDLYPHAINAAIEGEPDHPSLEIIPVLTAMRDDPAFEDALRKVALWQDKSQEQAADIDAHEVEAITYHKGGWSAVGHLRAMVPGPSPDEVDFARKFGFLAQLLDDYLDQPEDETEGISTMFTDTTYTRGMLSEQLSETEELAEDVFGDVPAVEALFNICRLHREVGYFRNETPLDPTRLTPWYL